MLVGFLEARHAQAAARRTPRERREAILEDLAAYFGPRGCYGAFAAPMALTRFGPGLRRPLGPLHWASTPAEPVGTGAPGTGAPARITAT